MRYGIRLFRISSITLALALGLAACGKSPEQHLAEGRKLVQQADYKAAVLELKTVLQEQPSNREARLLLGQAQYHAGAYAAAHKELEKALELGATQDQVLPLLAQSLVRSGEHQKVLDIPIPSVGLTPRSLAILHTARAEALLSSGKRTEADAAMAMAQQAEPKLPNLLLLQAKLALAEKRQDQAAQLVEAALREDATFSDALYLKASLLQTENKPDEAIKLYQQIVANDATEFRAHLAIASLHMRRKNMEAAEKAIQAAEKVAGQVPLVKYARGAFELQRGKLDKANSAFLDVLRVIPNHLPTALAYAMTSYGLGNYEQSIKSAGKVLNAMPNNLFAAKVLAAGQLKLGDAKEALKTIGPFLNKHGDDAKLLTLAGEAYFQLKDLNKAMGYLDKAAVLEPESPNIKTRQAAGHLLLGEGKEALSDLERAASLSEKPGQADLALVVIHLRGKEFDKALQAVSDLEKKAPNNPLVHNLRGTALLGKQDKAGARKAFENALALDPKFHPAAANLAQLDIENKQPATAKKRFEALLDQDANNLQAMLSLAELALFNKQEKEHLSWLEKAAKAHPKALQPKILLTRYYLSKKDFAKAIETARKTYKDNPENPHALNLLGATQMASQDVKSAVETYTELTQKAPNSHDAYLRLALAQVAAKNPAPARDSLNKALQLKPDFIAAMYAALGLEMADKKPDAALQWAKKIQSAQPRSPLGFDREGDVLMAQQRYAQAANAYQAALEKGTGTQGLIKLHGALMRAGNTKAAQSKLDAWVKSHPKDIDARVYAAGLFMRNGQDKLAVALYEEILRQQPTHGLALNNLAILYQKAGDARALPIAEQALKQAPDHPGIQDTVGWLLAEKGQLPRALDLLRSAAGKASEVPAVRYHYGAALARAGRKAEARKELEASLASGRPFAEMEAAKALLKDLR